MLSVFYYLLKQKDDKMPLTSIPPVHRGLANKGRSRRQAASFRPVDATCSKAPSATPVQRQLSPPQLVFPSIQDVKVMKTPHKGSWEFPNGEFVVMVGREEVHVEVRFGRFIDALVMKTDKE
jgi:hypothetical protein